jgi:hypothetical protein
MATTPERPSTTRITVGGPARTGMQSTTDTTPSGVVNSVSSTSVSPR